MPKRLAHVCESCRRKKRRCDFNTPCSLCKKLNIECIPCNVDGRAHRFTKSYVKSLEARLDSLAQPTHPLRDLTVIADGSQEGAPILCGGSISNLNPDLTISQNFEVFATARRFEHLNKSMIQCIALGAYLDFVQRVGMENVQLYLQELGSYLRSELRKIGVETSGPDDVSKRSPHSNVIPLDGKQWASHFANNGIYVSQYRCGTRASLGLYNDKTDIDHFVAVIKQGLEDGLTLHN